MSKNHHHLRNIAINTCKFTDLEQHWVQNVCPHPYILGLRHGCVLEYLC